MSSFVPGDYGMQRRLSGQTRSDTGEARLARQRILLATADSEVGLHISDLLQNYPVDVLRASRMEEIKLAIAKGNIAACLCGFWLVDGTYRDVVRHLKSQRTEVPVIIICAPTCPQEYRDYLAALNIRAFDFICHPYRRSDLERTLQAAIASRNKPDQRWASATHSAEDSFTAPDLRRSS
jgi:DNA-binding NtrC family response regulator